MDIDIDNIFVDSAGDKEGEANRESSFGTCITIGKGGSQGQWEHI